MAWSSPGEKHRRCSTASPILTRRGSSRCSRISTAPEGPTKARRRTIVTDLQTISPERAAELVRRGAVLVDVREADEHARERIPGARHHALSQLDAQNPARSGDDVLIFHCRSGARTQANADRLATSNGCETYILEGGIDAWKKAG